MEITVGQFIDAIEKNGLVQAFGSLFKRPARTNIDPIWSINREGLVEIEGEPEVPVIAACAYGQALINLGVYRDVSVGSIFAMDFYRDVWHYNDVKMFSLQEIARELRADYGDRLDIILADDFIPFEYKVVK